MEMILETKQKMKDFRKAWKRACKKAGIEGKLLRDFRRTVVRDSGRCPMKVTD